MNKQICRKCGEVISNDFNETLSFCTNCGAGIILSPTQEKTLPSAKSERLYSPTPQNFNAKTGGNDLRYVFGCLGLLIVALSGIFVHAQERAEQNLKEVDVYFWFIGTEGIEDEILPLKRKVSSKAPLFPAIEEMLKEPTEDEQKLGYVSAGYGDLKLVSVKIKRGTARVDFKRTISDDYNPGDLQTLKFESAVTKTAKQFPAVKKVVVCVNGINEFGIGLVEDAPRPCPREK